MTLSLFGRWIKAKNNRIEFIGYLMSYLSLKLEGNNHIQLAVLQQRLAVLKFTVGLAGIPWPLASVVAFQEVGSDLENTHFMPVLETDKKDGKPPRFMALVPREVPEAPPATCSTRFVTSWQARQQWPLFPHWVAEPSFVDWWNKLGSDKAPEVAADASDHAMAASSPQQPPTKDEPPSPQRKAHDNIQRTVSMLIQELGSSMEPKTKERDFTPVLSKLLNLKQDCLEAPQMTSSPLMKNVEETISAVRSAKKMVRHYRDYLKKPKVAHLKNLTEPLDVVSKWMKSSGIALGPIMGSTWVKAEFSQQDSVHDAVKVLQRAASSQEDTRSQPEHRSPFLINDCITNFLHTKMKQTVSEGDSASSAEAWAKTKAVFSEAVRVFSDYAQKHDKLGAGSCDLHMLLQSLSVVCGAAEQKVGITPKALQKALGHIETSQEGGRIQDGFGSGVGAALLVDAKELLVAGELDDEVTSDFLAAAQNILSTGLTMNSEDTAWVVPTEIDACQGSISDMVKILDEGVDKMSGVLIRWSAARVVDEAESVSELLDHISRHISLYDAGKMTRCVASLRDLRTAWESSFTNLGESTWPPPSLIPAPRAADLVADDEKLFVDFCTKVRTFCQSSIVKASALCPEVQASAKTLEVEVERFLGHSLLRASIWQESAEVSALLALPYLKGDDGIGDMVKSWSFDNAGFLATLMRIAAMRPPQHEYMNTSIISPGTVVEVDGLSTGYLPFSDNEGVVAFVTSWVQGVGINKVSDLFLFSQLDKFVELAICHMGECLDHLRSVDNVLKCESGQEFTLMQLLPESAIASLARQVADYDPTFSEATKLAGHLKLNGGPLLQPLRDLQGTGHCPKIQSKVCLDTSSHSAGVLLQLLELNAHMCDILMVASFVVKVLLSSPEALLVCVSDSSGASPAEVAPILFTCFDWMENACGLAWLDLRSKADAQAVGSSLRYPTAQLGKVVTYLMSTWMPSVKAEAGKLITKAMDKKTEQLKSKTPVWNHILSNSRYNSTLARKQLLNCPNLSTVGQLIEEIEGMMGELGRLLPEDVLAESTSAMEAEGVLEAAKVALAIVAAVHLVELKSKSDAGAQASELLRDPKSGIPEVLKAKLRLLAKSDA